MSLLGEHVLIRLSDGDAEEAVRAVSKWGTRVGGFVMGAGLFSNRGPILVGALGAFGKPLLVDLGILDQPRVVARAVARMGKLGARWISVSGLGGRRMVEAAVAEADGYPETSVVVSAALAGWAEDSELKGVGIFDTRGSLVSRMTKLALTTGAEGILFPARELGVVVQVSGSEGFSRMGNSKGFWRMADATGCLSSSEQMPEVDGIVAGGAHRVIIPQVRVAADEGE
ncbi:MAG: orotidine 5'-phosphate decarboxylase [Actinomycetia bacterium]|nr:orotidine 5'-phosphate decarboxylase [Actinomycetes bacterium]